MITTWGTVARVRGLSHRQNRSGKLEAAWTFNDFGTQLPKDPIVVTLNHRADMAAGQLVFGQLAEDGRVELVCVVNDALAAPDGVNIYYSGEWQPSGVNGDEVAFTIDKAELVGLSIVDRPANSEASPLRRRQGDIRSDRGSWPLSWPTEAPLLKRAADSLESGGLLGLRTRTAAHLVDLRDDGDYPWHLLPRQAWRQAGEPERPSGALRHGPPGRVLSVR